MKAYHPVSAVNILNHKDLSCLCSFRVRILLDYRPAFRERSGVGEFVHGLVRALVLTRAIAPDDVTLFTTSWKDRPAPALAAELPAVAVIDVRSRSAH